MYNPVSNVLSGLPSCIHPVVSALNSLSSKVSSVPQAHWSLFRGESLFEESSSSRWGYIKNQFRICLDMASFCMQQVAQTFYRFMTSISSSQTTGPGQTRTERGIPSSLNDNRLTYRNGIMNDVRRDGLLLKGNDAARFNGDKEIVLAAVAQNAGALGYASLELQADKEVVLAAVAQCGLSLTYASLQLQADKEVVLAAVTQYGSALVHASRQLRADKEVVLAAVAQCGWALDYASRQLRADKEVVLAAVTQDGSALDLASLELRADQEVVVAARAQILRAISLTSI